jgi:hypothetical protein
VEGILIDDETRLPIDGVKITKVTNITIDEYTDSFGHFEYHAISGGLLGCPKIVLAFEKEGYNTITKEYEACAGHNTVVVAVLEKQAK